MVAALPQLQWLDGKEVSKSTRILATQVGHNTPSKFRESVFVCCKFVELQTTRVEYNTPFKFSFGECVFVYL